MSGFANGFLFDDAGTLQTSAGPIASWNGGVPFDAVGNLGVTEDAPIASDPYVGGVRVSPTLGVYVINETPTPPNGFSSGLGQHGREQ